jgi:hypothetical protein
MERMFTPVENQPAIKVRLHLVSFNQGRAASIFSYHDLHAPPATAQTINQTLEGAVIGSLANVYGKLISQQRIRYKENPGLEFAYNYAQGETIYRATARVFLVGKRQYQISLLMEDAHFDEALAKAYLNSLRLYETDADLPPRPPARQSEKQSPN